MTLLYLFGQPGSGKSTLVSALTEGQMAMPSRAHGVRLIDYVPAGVTEIGARRGSFSGTDALGMNVIVGAIDWLPEAPDYVLAEGDRLACDRFFRAAKEHGDLELVYLDTPDDVAAERRRERGMKLHPEHGYQLQSPTWVKGRATKARRLAEKWEPIVLDGSQDVSTLVNRLTDETAVGERFAA